MLPEGVGLRGRIINVNPQLLVATVAAVAYLGQPSMQDIDQANMLNQDTLI